MQLTRKCSNNRVVRTSISYSNRKLLVTAVFLLLLSCMNFQLLANPITSNGNKAEEYLQKYGYIEKTSNKTMRIMDNQAFSSAVKEFQKLAGLEETGELDDATMSMMNAPRCGIQDKVDSKEAKMSRYSVGSRWNQRDLSYKVSKYSRMIKDEIKVDQEIERAFKVWSNVTSLRFSNINLGPVDINLRFQKRRHGDYNSFDGPGGTLAHASFPDGGGDICFDDEEMWTFEQYQGTNLFQVAAHEIGHSLGLGHSKVKGSLMYPIYQGYQPDFKLDRDDIKGIQSAYGRPPKNMPTLQPPDLGDDVPNLCQDSSLDAATFTDDRKIYIFKGDYYWRIMKNGIPNEYPRRISSDWAGLPGYVDAAVTLRNKRTYFFKGNQFYKFQNMKMVPGFPKNISIGFEGIPDDIDAAFVWSRDNRTYFFKGDKYWRYDRRNTPPVSPEYPKPISDWGKLSGAVDAILPWPDGRFFLFQQQGFYRFKAKSFKVEASEPPYPRSTSEAWFKCQKAEDTNDES